MAYAFHSAGFGIGLLLLILVAITCDYTLVLLIKSGELAGTTTYQGLICAAFGKTGYYVLTLLQFTYPFIGKYNNCNIFIPFS